MRKWRHARLKRAYAETCVTNRRDMLANYHQMAITQAFIVFLIF